MTRGSLLGGSLDAMVLGLRAPGVFPGARPGEPRVIETHISVVFLAGDRAYKLKKPVDLGFLDFRDPEVRRRMAREELRLNRRYAADVYLGLAAVRLQAGGANVGEVDEAPPEDAEWLVVMRRLPEGRMLDELLAAGGVTNETMDAVAGAIASFHAEAENGGEIALHGSPEALRRLLSENVEEFRQHADGLATPETMSSLAARLDAFLDERRALLERRADRGFVRDLHGDLHAGNVCVPKSGPPVLFDGLEFAPALRCGDVAGEVGFLDVDLEARGAAGLGERFVDRYVELTGDDELRQLLPLYGSYRALVRAKVAVLKGGANATAARYVDTALRRSRALVPHGLVVVSGLSASGKSTVARALARRAGLVALDTDRVRKRRAGLDPLESAPAAPGAGLYGVAATRATYAALLESAAASLHRGHSIVASGTFLLREQRDLARRMARESGASILFVELRAPPSVLETRLATRTAGASDANAGVLAWQREHAEPFEADEARDALVIETGDLAVTAVVERILERLGERFAGVAS